MSDRTQILHAIAEGDPQAASQLLPLVYDEPRHLAVHRLWPTWRRSRSHFSGFFDVDNYRLVA
jgi:hypothetical protein